MHAEFLKQVSEQFPADFMVRDQAELDVFGRDWTRVYTPKPSAVVFPRSTQEVAQLLKLCTKYRIPVVPSGGRTGLSGGAVAAAGEVVLSLNRMNHLGQVDPLSLTLRVQAGAVTQAVHHHCEPFGLTWPVDFASKGSSQVGGNISTNAGGVKVIRYGLTRNWILGLQVVTMEGEILELNGALEKNNTGIDLRQPFIGSEGTLGVVTEATLKLTRLPEKLDVFFFAVPDVPGVLKVFEEARKGPFQIAAFEFLTQNCLDLVIQARNVPSPFTKPHPCYVLLEIESPTVNLDQWLHSLFDRHLVLDGTLAQSVREGRDLWSLREGISESLSSRGFVHKNDIALPIANLESFIEQMNRYFGDHYQGLEVFLFGHIGDGNLHVNTLQPLHLTRQEFIEVCHQADLGLFDLVQAHQGSISAEHGIGLLKKDSLHFSRTAAELTLMRGLKKVFDPQNLMNPGKIFD